MCSLQRASATTTTRAHASSFRDDITYYAVRIKVASFRKSGVTLTFNETADAEGIVKTTYSNPLGMMREKATELPTSQGLRAAI